MPDFEELAASIAEISEMKSLIKDTITKKLKSGNRSADDIPGLVRTWMELGEKKMELKRQMLPPPEQAMR